MIAVTAPAATTVLMMRMLLTPLGTPVDSPGPGIPVTGLEIAGRRSGTWLLNVERDGLGADYRERCRFRKRGRVQGPVGENPHPVAGRAVAPVKALAVGPHALGREARKDFSRIWYWIAVRSQFGQCAKLSGASYPDPNRLVNWFVSK